jgi:hypothetical protein
MTTRRASQLAIGFSSAFLRQSAWDAPLDASDLDAAFPATSRNYLDVEETTEDVDDCTGEDFLFELLTGRVARLTVDTDVDPDILAGIMAFAYGVAAAPSGGTNEVQTETVTATGGTRTLTVQVGANAQTTAPIAWNANAAAIQAALEALSNVAPGDITVAGAGPYTYTMGGNLGLQDVNPITVNTYGLTGGTSVFAETTPGVGLLHGISRTTGYSLPLLTLYVGFRGSDKQPVIFKNVVVNSVRCRSTSRGKVTATIEFVGSADLQEAVGYTMPPCLDIIPVRFGDCQMLVGGVDQIAAGLGREFEYYYQNDVITGDHAFTGVGVDVTRLERADKRPSGFNFFILGEPGDPLFVLAKAKTTMAVALRVGPAGRHVLFTAPQGLLKLGSPQIRFGGDPPESEIALVTRPKKVTGDATTPTNVSARSKQATAFMVSA